MNVDDINKHNECTELIKVIEKEKSTKKTWIIIASCLGGFLIVAIIFLYCVHKRNTKRSTKFSKVRSVEPTAV